MCLWQQALVHRRVTHVLVNGRSSCPIWMLSWSHWCAGLGKGDCCFLSSAAECPPRGASLFCGCTLAVLRPRAPERPFPYRSSHFQERYFKMKSFLRPSVLRIACLFVCLLFVLFYCTWPDFRSRPGKQYVYLWSTHSACSFELEMLCVFLSYF